MVYDDPLLDMPLISAGKVRRLYQVEQPDRMLMLATDRVSAFDHVLEVSIPGKGIILTQLSLWWFEQLAGVVANHLVSTEVPAVVSGRAIVVEKLKMIPIEAVVRGYLTGSGWKEYQESGTVCGIELPEGLHDGAKLPEPIFTPAYKAQQGEHDENISYAQMARIVGDEVASQVRELSLAIYSLAAEIAAAKGIIVADTKFEFGQRPDGTIVLADEVLTPDSSRFWDAAEWQAGNPVSFDKQYLRDWLAKDSGWDPADDTTPPSLPDRVVQATRQRYLEAYRRLTGEALDLASSKDDSLSAMTKVIVDVMPKPEILDPQGKAVTGSLQRLGYAGLELRQGKRFEIVVDGPLDDERMAQIHEIAERVLANTVIESFAVRIDQGNLDAAQSEEENTEPLEDEAEDQAEPIKQDSQPELGGLTLTPPDPSLRQVPAAAQDEAPSLDETPAAEAAGELNAEQEQVADAQQPERDLLGEPTGNEAVEREPEADQ